MADTTVTVRQDGTGDYTTISSAMAAGDISSGYYKIEIDDSNTYTENIGVSVTGTGTIDNYVWITVSAGNRHGGVAASSGHARIVGSSLYGLHVYEDFTRIEYLQINALASRECIKINGRTGILVSRCLLLGPTTADRAIYAISNDVSGQSSTRDLYVDNCVISNTRNDGIRMAYNQIGLYVDHCTIADNDGGSIYEAGIVLFTDTSGSTVNLYNNILVDVPTYSYKGSTLAGSPSGTTNITDSGSHNIYDESVANTNNNGSITDWVQATSISDTTSGSSVISVNETDLATLDYTLTNLTVNPAAGSGTNRIGSEPDPRQDFSTDIAGNPRTTKAGYIDRGAYQVTVAPAAFKYWDGSAWADSTAVQYWNGSAWTDVTGIQYWNGSAWTDPS